MGGVIDVRSRRRVRGALVLLTPLVLLACRAEGDGPTVQAPDSAEVTTPGGGTAGATRTVPTVPPSTLAGQVATDSGVIDASPTIAPVPVDPGASTTLVVPPTTDLIGDPQPSPASTLPAPPPPSTVADDPDACARLAAFDIVGVIADTAGVATSGTSVNREVCRYTTGSFIAEVHYVTVAQIRDDWYLRPGIQPVGEVGSDAVGFDSFIPPGSPSRAGYTIALEAGSRGAIVAVAGVDNPRQVAAQVAIFAGQAG